MLEAKLKHMWKAKLMHAEGNTETYTGSQIKAYAGGHTEAYSGGLVMLEAILRVAAGPAERLMKAQLKYCWRLFFVLTVYYQAAPN